MQWIRKVLVRTCASLVTSVAVVGLVFPPQILAQAPIGALGNFALEPDRHLAIEVLAMEEGQTLPASFRASLLGRSVIFQRAAGGYDWVDENDAGLKGFQALPDLADVLEWQIDPDDDGLFRAEVPASHFNLGVTSSNGTADGSAVMSKVGGAKVETFGIYDRESKTFAMSAVSAGGEGLLDLSISFAGVPDHIVYGVPEADLAGGELPEKLIPVTIGLATILRILGVAFISCFGIQSLQVFLCEQVCDFGVHSTMASCVPPEVTCVCFPPPDPPPPPPGPCVTTTVDQLRVIGLGESAGAPTRLASAQTLERFEVSPMSHGGVPMYYQMGEWAVVSYVDHAVASQVAPRVLRASSPAFGHDRLAELSQGVAAKSIGIGGSRTALLLALPPHEDNARQIPLPTLYLEGTGASAAGISGQLLVRADFSEDRRLSELEVLHDTLGGVSPALVEHLERSLYFEYASAKEHRAVAFAVIEVGDGVSLGAVETYLPKCCGCQVQPPNQCQ